MHSTSGVEGNYILYVQLLLLEHKEYATFLWMTLPSKICGVGRPRFTRILRYFLSCTVSVNDFMNNSTYILRVLWEMNMMRTTRLFVTGYRSSCIFYTLNHFAYFYVMETFYTLQCVFYIWCNKEIILSTRLYFLVLKQISLIVLTNVICNNVWSVEWRMLLLNLY